MRILRLPVDALAPERGVREWVLAAFVLQGVGL